MMHINGPTLKNFLLGESFQMALRYTIGSLIPMIICIALGQQNTGLQIMLGVIIVCGADRREPVRKKVKTMLVTLLLSFTLSNIVHFAGYAYFLLIPLIFLFIFLLAYVAPFGNRYANIAFMGNMSVIIALSTLQVYQEPADIIQHTLLLLTGGIWYSFFALTISLFSTPYQLKKTVSTCMEQTIAYLWQRVKLFDEKEDLGEGLLALSDKQTELTYTQNDLRDFLFQRISLLHKPASQARRMLLIFAELLEILEAALATPIDYQRWRQWLVQYPELHLVPEISTLMVKEMEELHRQLFNHEKRSHTYVPLIEEKKKASLTLLKKFFQENAQDEDKKTAYTRALRIRMYQEIQLKKLASLQLILENKWDKVETYLDESSYHLFANTPEISWSAIKDNFTIRSSHFRFALRTTVTALAGYLLGILLVIQNPYWVLLTILVILKPGGYSISRQRLIHRIIGTVIGAVIAYGLYSLHPSDEVSLIIFGIAFFLAFNFALHVYAVSTLFFTIHVIFLYSFLHREIPSSVLFRVIDTMMGAALCWGALHYLWPSWEYGNFPYHFRKSLASNRELYQHILDTIAKESFEITAYRLARKQAYIHMANVVSSFQRLKSEPRRMQKNVAEYGSLLLLNAALLSVISSIGLYISYATSYKKINNMIRKRLAENAELLDHILTQMQADKNFADHPEALEQKKEGFYLNKAHPNDPDSDEKEDEFLLEEVEHLNELLLRMKTRIEQMSEIIDK